MTMDVSFYTSKGGRKNNEDFVSVEKKKGTLIAIVADGLGGHDSGEIASKLAVKTVISELKNKTLSAEELEKAIVEANTAVINKDKNNDMKTTLAVLWTKNDEALFANVGDTRIYLFRDNKIIFQSIDHSVSQMSVMAGEITAEQIRGHKDRNKLVRVLGYKDSVKPYIKSVKLMPRDGILICSDGFWENIIEDEMCRLYSASKNSKAWLSGMKASAEAFMRNDNDNNSAVAIII